MALRAISKIKFGNIKGEYVSGAWTIHEVEFALEESDLSLSAPLVATWDPEAEIQILRWQEEGMLYEIIFAGSDPDDVAHLTKNKLIALAESMQ